MARPAKTEEEKKRDETVREATVFARRGNEFMAKRLLQVAESHHPVHQKSKQSVLDILKRTLARVNKTVEIFEETG